MSSESAFFEFRAARAEDLDAIAAAFLADGTPGLPDRSELRWRARAPGGSPLFLLRRAEEIVAVLGYRMRRLRTRKRTVPLGLVDLAWVQAEFRLGGIHAPWMEMLRLHRAAHENPAELALLATRLGHEDDWTHHRTAEFAFVSTAVVFEREAPKEPGALTSCDLLEPGEWPATDAAFPEEEGRLGLDLAALRHALERPGAPRGARLLAREGQPVGCALWREEEGVCVIEELRLPADALDEGIALLAGLPRPRARVGLWNLRETTSVALARGGFVGGGGGEPRLSARLALRAIKQPWMVAQWELCCEALPEPAAPLGSQEAIIHPPPAGTPPTRGSGG